MQFGLQLSKYIRLDESVARSPNLCDRFSDEDQTRISELVWEGYTRDDASRQKWLKRMDAGMNLALQIQEAKNYPWPGCSAVVFPLVTVAALQFSARSYGVIIQGTDVVRYRVIGDDSKGLSGDRAKRIGAHMSWQVLEEDVAWEEQHDRLLINLAIVGTAFVKSYFDPSLGHNVSELVMARDFVIDYYARSVEAAARKTHVVPLYRNEIYERCMSGRFQKDILESEWFNTAPAPHADTYGITHDNRAGIMQPQTDADTPFRTLEQHRYLDLDGDGYAEPYIATIEESSHKLCRLVARWESDADVQRTAKGEVIRIKPTEYFTKYSFIPSPDGGIYDVGFGVLLGPLNESVDSGINQLIDSGTMQNSSGGFLGRGAKIRGGVYTMAPWEWKRVDSTGDDLRKSMVPFPERQPSQVMFQLIGLLIEYTNRIAGTVDQTVGENPGQNTPAETSRNTLEQGMQVFSMIFKRVWRSMKEEFKKLHELNGRYLPLKQEFGTKGNFALREDYKDGADQVVPVADPNIVSKSTRVAQAMALRQSAMQVPGYDVAEVERNWIRSLGLEEVDRYYPGADKVPPLPNPKMAVEQAKLQGKQMDHEHEKAMFLAQLREDRRKLDAEITKLNAEAMATVQGVTDTRAATRIAGFELMMKAMQAHSKMLTDRIQAMSGASSDGGAADKPNGAGVQGMEGGPGNAGLLPSPAAVGGGSEGAVGGGSLQ